MNLLQEESELEEIVRLVGIDALGTRDRLKLETARSIREDYLHQNAFHEVDTYTSLEKQLMLLRLILKFYEMGQKAIESDIDLEKLFRLPVRESIGRFKYIPENECGERFEVVKNQIEEQVTRLIEEGGFEYA
jgi:V/A-type H+-transporting ATPase subunit A